MHFRARVANNQIRRSVSAVIPFSRVSCLDVGPILFEVGRECVGLVMRVSTRCLAMSRFTRLKPRKLFYLPMVCYTMMEAGKVNFAGGCGFWPFGTPTDMYVYRAAASTILSIVYDIPTVSSADDPTVTTVNKFNEILVEYANPRNYLVEFFPWMLYIPSSMAKWKREAKEARRYFTDHFEGMVHDVQHRIVCSCFASYCWLLNHTPCRTKGMNTRVSLET